MDILFSMLRIPSGETEFAGFLTQVIVVGVLVLLVLLLAVMVFWRARKTRPDRTK